MSPLIDDHQQRSPLLPVIKQHLALPDVGSGPPELALPLQIVKSDQGGSLLEGPLCASAREPERMPSTDSLADRAEEYGVLGKPPPYPEGGSADDTASPFSYPPSAPTQHLVVPMQLAVPPFAPSPPPPLLATSAAKSLAAETEAAQSAIQALLSLQRDELSPARERSPPGATWSAVRGGPVAVRAHSPSASLHGAIGKSEAPIRFYCRYPGCGKGYASTDAVRKHCRQRHLEWLRQLGHGCPALYCRWEEP